MTVQRKLKPTSNRSDLVFCSHGSGSSIQLMATTYEPHDVDAVPKYQFPSPTTELALPAMTTE
ncbi:hypothetical protein BJX66DRAFT_307304 [Aspergillus keveii]|uniref:Uncharacterized protein n=1 Tax=Aspergillus keveii TaxID=714993 RepID=A0ABR4G156_9EURO